MNKWEYTWLFLHREAKVLGKETPWFLCCPDGTRVENQAINFAIQELGNEGWELVAVVPVSNLLGSTTTGWTNELDYIFKRPK
jgi:hypothetical protein